jgi:hypothetical protein
MPLDKVARDSIKLYLVMIPTTVAVVFGTLGFALGYLIK